MFRNKNGIGPEGSNGATRRSSPPLGGRALHNMQELEAMIRRVVAEELERMFPPEEEQEQEESEEAIRPFIGQD